MTDEGLLRVRNGSTLVAEMPNKALVDEAPLYDRSIREPTNLRVRQTLDLTSLAAGTPWLPPTEVFKRLLASPQVASKRWVYRQYDHMVRTNTLRMAGMSAGVVRVKGTKRALAFSVDGNGRYCFLDPRQGAMLAVAEAARNVACTGAEPIGATNCLNFGNPERPEIMWQFVQAVDGIAEACLALGIPITGGNVSLYNETDGQAIYPTPVLGVVGLIDDATRVLTRVFPAVGLEIVLLGDAAGDLGGSEYLTLAHGLVGGRPAAVDLDRERALQTLLVEAARDGLIRSAHDCAEGGFAVTLAECCVESGGIGARVALSGTGGPDDRFLLVRALFGEAPSRVVVSVPLGKRDRLLGRARGLLPVGGVGLRLPSGLSPWTLPYRLGPTLRTRCRERRGWLLRSSTLERFRS